MCEADCGPLLGHNGRRPKCPKSRRNYRPIRYDDQIAAYLTEECLELCGDIQNKSKCRIPLPPSVFLIAVTCEKKEIELLKRIAHTCGLPLGTTNKQNSRNIVPVKIKWQRQLINVSSCF